jgi:hypothetical protein
VWDTNFQFLLWGQNAQCSAWAGGNGPPIPCGASARDIGASQTGSAVPYFTEASKISPWMWDNNGAFDSNPMTTTGTVDGTATFWGASATCALGGAAQCQTSSFYRPGFMFIGPFNQLAPTKYMLDATFKTLSGSSSFTLTINAAQSVGGGGDPCTSGFTQLYQGTVSTTTSFGPPATPPVVDMTGHSGCVLNVVYSAGSTTDTLVVDRFNLVPYPGYIRGPASAPTYPGSCPAGTPNSWLGVFSGFSYFCDSGTVKRVAVT